jgi:4,5-DOPA dioxygenase extradiol
MKISRRQALAFAGAAILTQTRKAFADKPMPAGFVGHGSPMLAIDPIRGAELRKWGSALPRPTGIVAMTPHYRARGLKIGHVGKGKALQSFPDFMKAKLPSDLDYPSPDNTQLAHTVADFLAPLEPTFDESRGGFDHTTWMPLRHLFPDAPVPVVEIAMPFFQEKDFLTLGRRLSPLRHQGVFILASGSITHNLAAMNVEANAAERPPNVNWVEAFDAWTEKTLLARDLEALLEWRKRAPNAELAHPDDGGHFRVLFVALGASSGVATFPVHGIEMGTQSKRCIELA